MAKSIKFKYLTPAQFTAKYDITPVMDDDFPQMGEPGVFGEVKIPGHGWHGCVLADDGFPSDFWSDDDGWQKCPIGVKYEQV